MCVQNINLSYWVLIAILYMIRYIPTKPRSSELIFKTYTLVKKNDPPIEMTEGISF